MSVHRPFQFPMTDILVFSFPFLPPLFLFNFSLSPFVFAFLLQNIRMECHFQSAFVWTISFCSAYRCGGVMHAVTKMSQFFRFILEQKTSSPRVKPRNSWWCTFDLTFLLNNIYFNMFLIKYHILNFNTLLTPYFMLSLWCLFFFENH